MLSSSLLLVKSDVVNVAWPLGKSHFDSGMLSSSLLLGESDVVNISLLEEFRSCGGMLSSSTHLGPVVLPSVLLLSDVAL